MKISKINFTKIKTDNSDSVRGIATVVIDEAIAIHGVKVVKDKNNNLFVAMPNYKSSEGKYIETVHPVTSDARKYFTTAVLDEYNKALEKAKRAVEIEK